MNEFANELFKTLASTGYYDMAWRLGATQCSKDLQELGVVTDFMSTSEIFNAWVEKKMEKLNEKKGEEHA